MHHLAAILQVSLSTGSGRCTGGAGEGRRLLLASLHSGSVSHCQSVASAATGGSLASAGDAAARPAGVPAGRANLRSVDLPL